MRAALANPAWHFEHSIYFGCREPHLPLELGFAAQQLAAAGHETLLLDGLLEVDDNAALGARAPAFRPDITVVTTAPTYLFWRCAPPGLRVPREFLLADAFAWERAHRHYLQEFSRLRDIQDERPLPMPELEATCGSP